MAKYLTGPSKMVWHLGGTPLPKLSSSADLPPLSTLGVDEPSPASDLGGVFNVRFGTWQARLFLRRIKVTCGFSSVYRSALHTEECFFFHPATQIMQKNL